MRLAIMAGVCSKSGKNSKVENAFDIFRNYYSPIVDEFDKTELIVASIIAFYDAFIIDKDALPLKLATQFGIDEKLFVDCCTELERKEVIASRENLAVKFDNQNLQDYFLYYAVLFHHPVIFVCTNHYRHRDDFTVFFMSSFFV